ncbi:MAG: CDP-alcohol phosphatidyltransferase family protein [Allosphingosinicella sp.]
MAYDDAASAARRVAGVASAARTVRTLAAAGHDPVWLALPEGASLPAGALADLARLAPGTTVRIAAGAAQRPTGDVGIVAVPGLRTADILRACGKASDGPVSRWFNRPLSREMSALLLLWPGVRPIHATFGTALLAAAMFAALLFGGSAGLVAGGLLFHFASVFDGVDGEIARATFRSSAAGAALDSAVDLFTLLLFLAGLILNLALSHHPQALVVGGWGVACFAFGLLALSWRAARAGGPFNLDLLKHAFRRLASGRAASVLVASGTIVTSRDFFALLFAILILVGRPMAVLWIFATAASLWLPFVLAVVPMREPVKPRSA